MKTFLRKLHLFLLPPILLAYPVDLVLSNQLSRSLVAAASEYPVWNDLYQGRIEADVVIYGSSRAWVQIDPQIIESTLESPTYNLGIDGQTFWLQHLRHRVLLANNRPPRQIILSLDSGSLLLSDELYNSDQFLPYMLFNDQVQHYTEGLGFSSFDFYLPLIRYRGRRGLLMAAGRSLFGEANSSDGRMKGFRARAKTWDYSRDAERERFSPQEVQPSEELIVLLRDFLEECQDLGIEVTFVFSPEHVLGQRAVANREEITDLYARLASDYSIRFLDYSRSSICERKELFYNTGHLNKQGAELFTKMLAKDLIESRMSREKS